MGTISAGARRLPLHHVTIRVPWHDGGWTGSVCARPLDNTSCLILPRVGEGRRDEVEARCAAQRLDDLDRADLPPCVGERVSFMASFALARTMTHPYTEFYPETHGHFAPTRFVQPAYSAACVPYRWMLREKVEGNAKDGEIGLAERLKVGWVPEREPDIRNHQGKEVETDWIQERENQLALLDTFFGALRPEDSLCFFYAKRTPLSEQARRVIVGVGRVLSVGEATEYVYSVESPPLRCVLWERNVGHSVRTTVRGRLPLSLPGGAGGRRTRGIDPEEVVAFAPNEHIDTHSFSPELLADDGAVASLVACAAMLHRICGRIEEPWDLVLAASTRPFPRSATSGASSTGACPPTRSNCRALPGLHDCGSRAGRDLLLGVRNRVSRERRPRRHADQDPRRAGRETGCSDDRSGDR
jgi:hypothetical protein